MFKIDKDAVIRYKYIIQKNVPTRYVLFLQEKTNKYITRQVYFITIYCLLMTKMLQLSINNLTKGYINMPYKSLKDLKRDYKINVEIKQRYDNGEKPKILAKEYNMNVVYLRRLFKDDMFQVM